MTANNEATNVCAIFYIIYNFSTNIQHWQRSALKLSSQVTYKIFTDTLKVGKYSVTGDDDSDDVCEGQLCDFD